ncbi:endonuclease/exonuclease/phosphatase family protein [Pseudomonas sp. AO-1]|uniref:endonuclease/exonuclease/phosphatase family protein n=1 Tax=Pseudomonas sp. AO-1 TaxID=2855434 RepID=UPI001C784AF7|nr:endonuclease/exonuclease/phosphatase family protein [Pseudomonas sp. AO-1]QXZ14647.1 endonuclease/exonuclease/phosphatase family protein [Pseudomonas sp. AO-1]
MKLTVLTYNTLFGGRDGVDNRRAQAQTELINDLKPDVFLMQEAKGFDLNGSALLYELEQRLGMRGFMAAAPRTGQNVVIFIRSPLQPLSFESDSAHFHHALATLKVSIPGVSRTLTFICAHLCPNGPAVRRREAAYLAVQANPDVYTLLTGDFNSSSPRDPEPVGFHELPPHHRFRYLSDDLRSVDHSVIAGLEAAGWIDIGYTLKQSQVPTVPAAQFIGTEFAHMRCDYMFASHALAGFARTYEVIRSPVTDMASDHYPVLATFEID